MASSENYNSQYTYTPPLQHGNTTEENTLLVSYAQKVYTIWETKANKRKKGKKTSQSMDMLSTYEGSF